MSELLDDERKWLWLKSYMCFEESELLRVTSESVDGRGCFVESAVVYIPGNGDRDLPLLSRIEPHVPILFDIFYLEINIDRFWRF